MPQIVEPKAGEPRFLRQGPPCRPPAIDVPRGVVPGKVVADNLGVIELELRNECGEDVMHRVYRSERFGPRQQPCQG